jgi:hypothetical protein
MKLLNRVLINNKFSVSFWSFQKSYYDRGEYNKFYRTYRRVKKITDLEQYIDQKQHIIDIMKADEDDGLYKMFDTNSDKKH